MAGSCFIVAPITTPTDVADAYGDSDHFINVITHLLIPAVEHAGFDPISPVSRGADVIHAEIVRQLETCEMVVCDLSSHNPNVFFELGIRTAVNKPVCLVKDAHTTRIPFDAGIINTHTYNGGLSVMVNQSEIESLSAHLLDSHSRSEGQNGLWRYFGLTSRGSFESADRTTAEEKLDFLLAEVSKLDRAPERRSMFHGEQVLASVLHAMSTGTSQADLKRAVDQLPARERMVISLRFGLDGEQQLKTLADIAKELGMTRNSVRTAELQGLQALLSALGGPSGVGLESET